MGSMLRKPDRGEQAQRQGPCAFRDLAVNAHRRLGDVFQGGCSIGRPFGSKRNGPSTWVPVWSVVKNTRPARDWVSR
jgi:hypothetical protein